MLEELKNYLDITWDDALTDIKLQGIMQRGQTYLNKKTGTELDFDNNDRAKDLLFEYCRHTRNGTMHEFEKFYLPMLKTLIEENGGSYGKTL